jgi:hypothetical protein
MRGDLVVPLSVGWPASCTVPAPGREVLVPGAVVERSMIDCGPTGLAGQQIEIEGLKLVSADVLVRIQFADGAMQTNILRPASSVLTVVGPQSTLAIAAQYALLGFEHILAGIDHLIFVLALIFIVRDLWTLIKTITAFTVAHSITLALATLNVVQVPSAPVETVIALSIVFLARELVEKVNGREGLTSRMPWLVAFLFGLLHGLGFASALREVGLPQSDIALALFSFNVGVEIGQLAFVGVVLTMLALGRRLVEAPKPWVRLVPAYAIGTIAVYWTFNRLLLA